MKNCNLRSFVATLGLALAICACGHKDTESVQSDSRGDQRPLLQGIWKSKCEGSKINTLKIDGDRLSVERTTFYDAECVEAKQTMNQSGTYELAHTFKTGVLDSIIYSPDNKISVTINNDFDVEAQNNVLANIRNEKSGQTTATMTPPQKKQVARENAKLAETQKLTEWKTNEPKTLSNLQLEKLQALGLGANPAVALDSRASLRYEVDNGFLLMSGSSDFAHVFTK